MSRLFQFKIQLKNVKPSIYRTIVTPDSSSFFELHNIIQDAMGWCDCHLFQFFKDRRSSISIPDEAFDGEVIDATKLKINDYFKEIKDSITYEYDFGDGWEHLVTLEKITDNAEEINYPVCIRGKRNCPPEDCGGPWGYENFLETITNKNHPQHKEMLDWVDGEFDPEEFDIDDINDQLKDIKIKV
jgi:hypothetical protein